MQFLPPNVRLLLLLLSSLFLLSPPTIADDDPYHAWDSLCLGSPFTPNTTYAENLNITLTNITSQASTSGYSTQTLGVGVDQVFGLVLCRGDINTTECEICLNKSRTDILQHCPTSTGGLAWYNYCLIYYSHRVLSLTNNPVRLPLANQNDANDVDRFTELVNALLNATADYAAKKSKKRFATGQIDGFSDENLTMYGLAQCTPDMKGKQCRKCLQDLFDSIPGSILDGKLGGRVLGVRCNMRYEVYSFFEGDSMVKLIAAASPSPSPSSYLSPYVSPLALTTPMASPADQFQSPPVVASPPDPTLTSPPDVLGSLSPAPLPVGGNSEKRAGFGVTLGFSMSLVTAVVFI